MACQSIRRLTPAERAHRNEQHAARYEELTIEIQAEELHEYNEQFGPTYQAKHPFKADAVRVHEKVAQRMRAEEAAYNESRVGK
jgi:hypothetical protein